MANYKAGTYLEQIELPSDLRDKFKLNDLPHVSNDLRQYIIDVISEIEIVTLAQV